MIFFYFNILVSIDDSNNRRKKKRENCDSYFEKQELNMIKIFAKKLKQNTAKKQKMEKNLKIL